MNSSEFSMRKTKVGPMLDASSKIKVNLKVIRLLQKKI
jgi:hypothetical protein